MPFADSRARETASRICPLPMQCSLTPAGSPRRERPPPCGSIDAQRHAPERGASRGSRWTVGLDKALAGARPRYDCEARSWLRRALSSSVAAPSRSKRARARSPLASEGKPIISNSSAASSWSRAARSWVAAARRWAASTAGTPPSVSAETNATVMISTDPFASLTRMADRQNPRTNATDANPRATSVPAEPSAAVMVNRNNAPNRHAGRERPVETGRSANRLTTCWTQTPSRLSTPSHPRERRASGAGCECPQIARLDFLAVLGDEVEVPGDSPNRLAARGLRSG